MRLDVVCCDESFGKGYVVNTYTFASHLPCPAHGCYVSTNLVYELTDVGVRDDLLHTHDVQNAGVVAGRLLNICLRYTRTRPGSTIS
jgi:hypothetical protein